MEGISSRPDELELTEEEEASIASKFPEWESEVQFVMRRKCAFNNQRQDRGVVAVSAHFVGIFNQKGHNKSFKRVGMFHILTMKSLKLNEERALFIELENGTVLVESGSLDLARIIYRNYSLSACLLPDEMKMKVVATSPDDLPSLELPLSVSQTFQFTFAAFCTKFEQKYDHSIVQYVHSLVRHSNAVVELNRIPAPYHQPLLMSLVHLPGFLGVSATDVDCPNAMNDVVGFVAKSKNLMYLRIDNCNCTEGLAELGKIIREKADSLQLETLIIANNEFEDLDVFIDSLKYLKTKLKTLSVSCVGMSQEQADSFIEVLTRNNAFKSLKRLGIGDIPFSQTALQRLSTYLKTNKHIRAIDLSGSSMFASVLKAVNRTTVNELCLMRCDFDDAAVAQLLEIAPNLTFCDVSGSNMKGGEVCDVIALLGRNQLNATISVKLNEMDFSGANLLPVLRGFLLSDLEKWKSIEMCDTQIKTLELETLQALFLRMPKLSMLSLDSNFSEEDVEAVARLLEIPELRSLSLANSKLSPLCPFLSKAKHLRWLNMSDNGLNDDDILKILSNKFEMLCLADNEFQNVIPIEDLANSHSSLKCDPLLKVSMDHVNDLIHLDQIAQKILASETIFAHSCICEDLSFPLPCMCSVDVRNVDVGDLGSYDFTHLNSIAVENGRDTGKLAKRVPMAPVTICDQSETFESKSSLDSNQSTLSMDPELQSIMKSRSLHTGDLPQLGPVQDDSEEDDDEVEIVRTGNENHVEHKPAPDLEEEYSSEDDIDKVPTSEKWSEEEDEEVAIVKSGEKGQMVHKPAPKLEEESEYDSPPPARTQVQARLFGSIAEEAKTTDKEQKKKKKRAPEPAPNATTRFWKVNASLLGSLKSKPSGSRRNPLLLAFSPPTLSKAKKAKQNT